jgi:hypothetical protein
LAIASLVCSFFPMFYGIGSVLAIIFGFVARGQIKRSGGRQQGSGLALAGIIVGIIGLLAIAAIVITIVVAVHHCNQDGSCTQSTTN